MENAKANLKLKSKVDPDPCSTRSVNFFSLFFITLPDEMYLQTTVFIEWPANQYRVLQRGVHLLAPDLQQNAKSSSKTYAPPIY